MKLEALKSALNEKGLDILSPEATAMVIGGCGRKKRYRSGKSSGKSYGFKKSRRSFKSFKRFRPSGGCSCACAPKATPPATFD